MYHQLPIGKTKVITHRVHHLLAVQKVDPNRVIVTTFTNKAALELKQRLISLLLSSHDASISDTASSSMSINEDKLKKRDWVDRLMVGTFHHIGALFLRRYAQHVNLKNDFRIYDQDESDTVIKMLLTKNANVYPKEQVLGNGFGFGKDGSIKPSQYRNWISQCKNRQIPIEQLAQEKHSNVLTRLFHDYNSQLRTENALDFDDLLIFTSRLFDALPNLTKSIQHLLIDEFQDTNTVQYQIMTKMARSTQNITIVGDPDQSIYGWRSANLGNLIKFQEEYRDLEVVFLEQNYRSTKRILSATLDVIRQDKERVDKGLWTHNEDGAPVQMIKFGSAVEQAKHIGAQIRSMMADAQRALRPNAPTSEPAVLKWSDFAILYRTNRQSNLVQNQLALLKVPFKVVGGPKFFDRKEIKDLMMGYVRLCLDPSDAGALRRVINVPARGIGEKTVDSLVQGYTFNTAVTLLEYVRDRAGMVLSGKKLQTVVGFIDAIWEATEKMDEGECSLREMVEYVIEAMDYRAYLQQLDEKERKGRDRAITVVDGEELGNRERNVEELLVFLDSFEEGFGEDQVEVRFRVGDVKLDELGLPLEEHSDQSIDGSDVGTADEEAENNDVTPKKLPTRKLLESLYEKLVLDNSPPQSHRDASNDTEKITLMTLHSSKGLEFPFVWILNVDSESMPHKLNQNVAEERRLLYVGMTRAMAVLTLTMCPPDFSRYSGYSMAGWSSFVGPLLKPRNDVEMKAKKLGVKTWQTIARLLKRVYDESVKSEDDAKDSSKSNVEPPGRMDQVKVLGGFAPASSQLGKLKHGGFNSHVGPRMKKHRKK